MTRLPLNSHKGTLPTMVLYYVLLYVGGAVYRTLHIRYICTAWKVRNAIHNGVLREFCHDGLLQQSSIVKVTFPMSMHEQTPKKFLVNFIFMEIHMFRLTYIITYVFGEKDMQAMASGTCCEVCVLQGSEFTTLVEYINPQRMWVAIVCSQK